MTATPTPDSGEAPKRRTESLRDAIRTGLIRVVGEQRFDRRVEELDRMTDGVLVEVQRHSKSHPRRRPEGIGPYEEQLLRLLAAGLDMRQISAHVRRPPLEVAVDVRGLYALLGAKRRLAAVVAAYELGILKPGRAAVTR